MVADVYNGSSNRNQTSVLNSTSRNRSRVQAPVLISPTNNSPDKKERRRTMQRLRTRRIARDKNSPLTLVQCRVHLHTLGLTGAVTLAEVRKAYRALALQHHPDKNVGGDPELATERFKQIGAAYEAICSHHEWLAQPRAP